jgi:hypothetical protein
MKARTLGTLAALVLLVWGSDVRAQDYPGTDEAKRWKGRVYLNVNGGYQPSSTGFEYLHTDMVLFEEQVGGATFNGAGGPVLDVGGGVRLAGNFGFGVAYSRYRVDQTADLTASVPHPFTLFFGVGPEPMVDELQVVDLGREEQALHIQAVYMFPITHRLQVGVFGGPSHFRCKQDLIRNYMFALKGDDLFDLSIELQDPRDLGDIVTEKVSAWGYNVGADVNYLFSDHVGIGMVVRYSGASVDFENPIDRYEERSQPQTFPVDLGGFQVAGGLRLRF